MISYVLSAFGYEFIFFVMTIYVYQINKSALNVGIFAALTLLPRLLAPFYGIISDRFNRARVLAWGAALTAVLVVVLVYHTRMAWIYPTWTLISVFLAIIANVRTALMTEIMPQKNYLRGNSLVLTALNLAKVCAPLLAGAVSIVLNLKSLFYLTALIYALAMISSSRIHLPVLKVGKNTRTVIADLKEGIKYIIKNTRLKFLISLAFTRSLLIGMQTSLFVIYVKTYLAGNDAQYGIFMTMIGLGSIAGSILGPWLLKRIGNSILIETGLSIHYASFIILGLLHNLQIALVVVFVSYVIFYITVVSLHSQRDMASQVEVRGRVYGSVTAILTPPAIISMLLGGYLANLLGVEKVLIGAGVLGMFAIGFLHLIYNADQVKEKNITA